ncbi:MAG: DUF3536 domain-containing protein, partial [Candidatus Jettenia caeni]|nr:DUF3536 domain-containing protein [Candidatus Jettenia caeni]
GAYLYEKFVEPVVIDLKKVGVHYAISSLFEDYPESTRIYCYTVTKGDYKKIQAGRFKLAVGCIRLISEITGEGEYITFGVIHLGDHVFHGGGHTFAGDEAYQYMKEEIIAAFERGAFANIIRLMDKYFGMHNYSLRELFKDGQRKILNLIMSATLEEFETSYRTMYENNSILMGFLKDTGMPVPGVFYTAAEFTLNHDLKKAFEEGLDADKIRGIVHEIKRWNVTVDSSALEFIVRRKIEKLMDELYKNIPDISLLRKMEKKLQILSLLPFEVNLWYVQNIYYKMAKTIYKDFLLRTKFDERDKSCWVEEFKKIGRILSFNTDIVLPKD